MEPRGGARQRHVGATSAVTAGDVRRRRRLAGAVFRRRGRHWLAPFDSGSSRASTGGGGVAGDGRNDRRRRVETEEASGGDGGDAPVCVSKRAYVRSDQGDVRRVRDTAGVPNAWPGHGGEYDGGGELRRSW